MKLRNENVVVVGAGINALGVIRSLGRQFDVLLVTKKDSYVDKSKYANRYYVDSTTNESIVEILANLSKTFRSPPVLLLTEEKTVYYVSLNRDRLSGYKFEMASHSLIESLQSKEGFQALAESAASPVPKSVVIKTPADLELLNKLTFPCVFKPMVQSKRYSEQFKKAYKVANSDEIQSLYEDIERVCSDMIAQEWIEGQDSDIYFCLAYFNKRGELISSFTGRKLRSWPLNIGGTAACTSAPEYHLELLSLTSKFVQNTNFIGLMGMEFKYDVQRKAFYMIEPTVGRTDYQHEIATLSGTDFLGDIVREVLGLSEKERKSQKKKAVIWFDEFADANALANGAQKFPEFTCQKIGALKRWYDLGPYLSYVILTLKKRFRLKT
ncbi:carboxylate--amine ligase [Thalassotalea ganghwensis]